MFEVVQADTVVATLSGDNPTEKCSDGRGFRNISLSRKTGQVLLRLQRAVLEAFLPRGYPQSVAPHYLRFQLFDSLQGLCSYLRGVLSTRAVLSGLGVGSSAASAAAATTQWVYRDGAGMVGGLLFAWHSAEQFGANAKGWRLFADLAVDAALTLELLSPLLCAGDRRCFTAVVCGASVLRAMCGVAAGATRAVITAFFAGERGNVADVQTKEGSQETAVSLVGMVLGLWLTRFVDASTDWALLPWAVFVALTVLHLVANYLAVAALMFPTLNESRLSLLLAEYEMKRSGDGELDVGRINRKERFVLTYQNRYRFRIGVQPEKYSDALPLRITEKRCVAFVPHGDHCVYVLMRIDCTSEDVVKAIAECVLGARNSFVPTIQRHGWCTNQLFLADHGFRVRPKVKEQ